MGLRVGMVKSNYLAKASKYFDYIKQGHVHIKKFGRFCRNVNIV